MATLLESENVILIDVRPAAEFKYGHIPGALNVGLGNSFSTWAGTVLAAEARVLLVLDDPADLWDASWQLLRTGYDLPVGWLSGGMQAWRTSGRAVEVLDEISVRELAARLERDEINLLDVRQPAEWAAGHVQGATFITGAELPERIGEVPTDAPLAVVCGTGYRSAVAASLLVAKGFEGVSNVIGGMGAWNSHGLATAT